MFPETRHTSTIKDYLALTKPRITLLCVFMTFGAMFLAPYNETSVFWLRVWGLVGTAMSVASANILNMVWERKSDLLMARTKDRPIATGRISAVAGTVFGVFFGVGSLVLLHFQVNTLTALLSLFAICSYVFVYTPLKRKTSWALLIGAVPGAIPPLMGWTAMTNELSSPGLVLFLVLFLWQIPHFIAISLFRHAEYKAAGIQTIPVVMGQSSAKLQAFIYSLAMIPASLMLVPLDIGGGLYAAAAIAFGLWFSGMSLKGLVQSMDKRTSDVWAKKFFFVSLVYLPGVTLALMFDSFLK